MIAPGTFEEGHIYIILMDSFSPNMPHRPFIDNVEFVPSKIVADTRSTCGKEPFLVAGNLIKNGSFETHCVPDKDWTVVESIPDWTSLNGNYCIFNSNNVV